MLIRMGIASLLPGMRVMQELIEHTIGEYKTFLANLQSGATGSNGHVLNPPKRRGRPPKEKPLPPAIAQAVLQAPAIEDRRKNLKIKAYWDAMTPEQRAAEVARRMGLQKKGKAKKKIGLRRDGKKPAGTHGWAGMTAEERSAEMKRRGAVSRGLAPTKAVSTSGKTSAKQKGLKTK